MTEREYFNMSLDVFYKENLLVQLFFIGNCMLDVNVLGGFSVLVSLHIGNYSVTRICDVHVQDRISGFITTLSWTFRY